jgi:mono/diheme cytochrome c family protein
MPARRIFMGSGRFGFVLIAAVGAASLTAAIVPLSAAQSAAPAVPSPVRKIFTAHCVGCHSGASPSAGLNLDPASLPASILDKSSGGKPLFKIADSAAPEKSYLLMKLRGAAGIAGSRMPLRAKTLTDEDIQVLADWLAGLKPQTGSDETKKI